ncbi:MAG: hypothetical protein JOZ41_03890 [Chloroflexi bacterium]|nr:hypothetical protein [Chloroflexota bacterium]
MWQDFREHRWRGWLLPIALVAAALIQAHILSYFPDWSRWLTPLVVGSSILLALVLVAVRLYRRANPSVALAALGLGVLALLLTPSIWTEYTVANAAGGAAPSAGPGARFGFGGGRPRLAAGRDFPFGRGSSARPAFGFGPPGGARSGGGRSFGPGGGDDGTAANKNLIRYLEAHQGRTKFLVATLNAGAAEPFILATDKPVMDLGGFMGDDRILTVSQLASDVKNGTVRYFLLSGRDRFRPADLPASIRRYVERRGGFFRGGFPGGPGGNGNNQLVQWVSKSCSAVPPSAYHTVSVASGLGFGGGQQLYDCGAYAAAHTGA